MVVVAVALVSPRTIAVTMPILTMFALVSTLRQGRIEDLAQKRSAGAMLAAVMLLFALGSALWADKPSAVFESVGTAAGYFVASALMTTAILHEPRRNAFHIAEGFWLGLIAGIVYLGIEIFSGQIIKLTLYRLLDVPREWLRPPSFFSWRGNELIAISPVDLARSIAPIPLLVWSAILALRATAPQGRTRLYAAGLYLGAGIVIFASEHESSKVAFVVGTIAYLVAVWRAGVGSTLLKIGWVSACLAVIPVTLALHRFELHTLPELQYSLRHRIVIWNYTAEQTLKSPIIGIGAGMMYQLDPSGVKADPGSIFERRQPHAHNVYLQTWFELGAVGAALLTLVGLALIERLQRLGDRFAPSGQATFASAAVMAAGSYGMWQAWFIAMFALCASMYAVALRANLPDGTALDTLERPT